MPKDTYYILTPPKYLPQLTPWDILPAHLTYRLSPNGRLLRHPDAQSLRGGIMVIGDCRDDLQNISPQLSLEIIQECLLHGYRGVLLDLEHQQQSLVRLVQQLGTLLQRQGVTLFIPEYYAPAAPRGRVLISTALSGGCLEDRLREAVNCFGQDRVVLAMEKTAQDFTLPALTGQGIPLTQEQLQQTQTDLHPCTFFSAPLCTRYFTYQKKDGSVHVTLYDDTETLCRKLDIARSAGIYRFLLPWQEISCTPEAFGLPSKNNIHFSAKN